jgi:cell division transport system ATP-binding protein
VADNLDFALRATGWTNRTNREARIKEVLLEVNLIKRHNDMPHTLSGGEQQRVAFARALLNAPALLIADEVTGNLDPDTSHDILELMRKLGEEHGTAVLFATHDYRLLERFQARVVRCEEGRVFNTDLA